MFACCPSCQTTFGITAEQLRSAYGQVRCGRCHDVFDAIPTLTDGLAGGISNTVDLGPPRAYLPESAAHAELDSADGPVRIPSLGDVDGLGRAVRGATDKSVFPGHRDAEDDVQQEESLDDTERADAVPEVLWADLEQGRSKRRSSRGSLLGAAAAVVLLLALVAQHAWFEPGDVLARYPQSQRLLARWCELTGCELPDPRDTHRIRVVTRDVRVHPRYEGALQVIAILVNTAPRAQPYPRIQFTLFNVNGQTIASRVFAPDEYLQEPASRRGDLRPRVPLQVALELLAPEEAAVSFEISFL